YQQAMDNPFVRADDAVPPVADDLLRAKRRLDHRQYRATDPAQRVRVIGHLQFRDGWHRLFARGGTEQGRWHGRFCLERPTRGGIWPARRPPVTCPLRNTDNEPPRNARRDLRLHRRGAIRPRSEPDRTLL